MSYGDEKFHNYTVLSCTSGLTNLYMIKSLLGLGIEVLPSRPLPLASSIIEAAKIFQAMKLPVGRTVLIAPLAKSYPHKLPDSWWEQAVTGLLSAGFTVVNNVANGSQFSTGDINHHANHIEDAIPVDIPIDMIIPFSELCGNFLGVRSGLCDLLAFSNTKIL